MTDMIKDILPLPAVFRRRLSESLTEAELRALDPVVREKLAGALMQEYSRGFLKSTEEALKSLRRAARRRSRGK